MPVVHGTTGARQVTFEARITRADGTVEELGVIAYYHVNPLRRWAWHIRRKFNLHRKGKTQ